MYRLESFLLNPCRVVSDTAYTHMHAGPTAVYGDMQIVSHIRPI